MTPPISFREASSIDADALGAVHVASWRETYPGMVSDEVLAGLSAEARAIMWRSVLADPEAYDGTRIFVAENESGIVGFGACGRQRDAALQARCFDGEIGAVYILQSHQRAGVGRALMRMMADALVAEGRRAASLWVLQENSAARVFYECLGGMVIAEKESEVAGALRIELAYGWSDLSQLTGPRC